ncbi:MAG: tetratricopeptide repeat protein [Gemmatimonadota bacterium]
MPRVIAMYGAAAFAVIEAADAVFPRLALPDWSVTLVVALALLGLPVVVVLAWAFEMTPEGMRRTAEASPGELTEMLAAPAHKQWASGLLALAGLMALLAGAWFVGRQSAPAEDTERVEKGPVAASVAVLPFVNMSSDDEQEYFSDGISEELLNLLAKIPELRVASRTSAFSFKNQNLEIPEIARRLDVAHVLEGSVRKAGDEVRITAQLIDGRSDTHLWSATWDRTLEDIFAVQDEIAAEVAAQLKVTLLGEPPHVEETDPEAYALFLQARQLGRQGTAAGFERSNELLRQALAIDSAYAPAWSELAANLFVQAGVMSGGQQPFDARVRPARDAAERALAIDPRYAPAHATLSRIANAFEGDLAEAARRMERALELAPTDSDILSGAAILASDLGRLDESIALQGRAVALDRVNPRSYLNRGLLYQSAGRWDEAISQFRTALDLAPSSVAAHHSIGRALLGKGEFEAALAANEREPDEGWRLLGRVAAYHDLGRAADSDAALRELIAKYGQEMAYNIAGVLAYRGEADRAFEWLGKAVEYGDPGLSEIPLDRQWFSNLTDEPRWIPFLESIGKSPGQLAAIQFEVRLPE